MGFLERIYDKSPIFFQNIMCTISGYQRNAHRYGKIYWNERKFLQEFDNWTLDEKLKYQENALRDFLRFAVENSPFYKQLYKDIDITDIKSVDDLKKLPVVDKEMLRSNIERVFAVPKEGSFESHTGGTTGKSLVVRTTGEDSMRRMAMLDHFKARVGFEHRKMKRATFNGKHIVPPTQKARIFWRYNAACKQMIYSSFHITEKNIPYYVKSLNKFKPDAIDGFFTSMCDVASYIERHNVSLQFKPVAIFPTSETLTQSGRELLERVFGCKVYDQYASSEGAPFVTECSEQRLHIELASGVFEHLSDDDSEILVTSFTTHGTPLIRYRIGDRMEFDVEDSCSCGMSGPLVCKIQGRRLDFLYTPEGAKINTVNMANSLKNLPNVIIRAQFRQSNMSCIDALLEVDPTIWNDSHKEMLKDELLHRFGPDMNFNIQIVNEIPRESSGKFRMIINTVDC